MSFVEKPPANALRSNRATFEIDILLPPVFLFRSAIYLFFFFKLYFFDRDKYYCTINNRAMNMYRKKGQIPFNNLGTKIVKTTIELLETKGVPICGHYENNIEYCSLVDR